MKVGTVACGRHKDGLASSLKTFSDAERLRFMSCNVTPRQALKCADDVARDVIYWREQ